MLTSRLPPSFPFSVLIAYTKEGEEAPAAFTTFANSHRDSYLFGHASLAVGGVSEPSIVLYKTFDEGKNVLSPAAYNALTAESLGDWIRPNAVPLLDEISPENFATYAGAGLPIAYIFVDPEQTEANAKLIESLKPVAAEHKGALSFVSIDAIKFIDHAKSLNLPTDKWPGFVIQDLTTQTKFPLKAGSVEWDAKTVAEFANKFVKGEIKPDVKSAPVKAVQEASVWDLVTDEYEKVVWEDGADKDIFIEFYARTYCVGLLVRAIH